MVDIAMCHNKFCLARKRCYRFMAKPDPDNQCWFNPSPIKDGICPEFIAIDFPTNKTIAETKKH